MLSDISFQIEAGQTVGIIGRTGAAKTTLVQLIPRLYDVTQGQILIDGHPVQEYPLKPLRDSIAVVLQKNTLFSGTVKITCGGEKRMPRKKKLRKPAGLPVWMNS